MSLRGKIIILMFLFESLLFLTAGFLLYQEHQSRVNETLGYISSSLKNRYERNAKNLKRRYSTRIKGFVSTTPEIRSAILNNDLNLLRNSIKPRLATLQREDDHFFGISFVLADGRIFYNTTPEIKTGQNIAHFPFVKRSLQQKTPQNGLSLSLAGLAYRFSHPIYAGSTYLGMAVFVVNAGATIDAMAQDYGIQGGIFIDKHLADGVVLKQGITLGDGSVLAMGVGDMFSRHDFLNLVTGKNASTSLNYNKRNFHRLDDLNLVNTHGEIIARVIAVLETTRYLHEFNKKLYQTFIVFTIVFAVTLASLYILVGKLLKLEDINLHLSSEIEQEKNAQKKLRKLSETDALTRLYNRRKFEDIYTLEWNAAKREHRPLSVLIIDIDFFKLYNDNYGHIAGDEALRSVAGILKAGLMRPRDQIARYGGEEFICLLPETSAKAAEHVAENLRNKVKQSRITHEFSAVENAEVKKIITVSIGVASIIPEHNCDPKNLINQADKALYHAKNSGRNQVKVFTVTAADPPDTNPTVGADPSHS